PIFMYNSVPGSASGGHAEYLGLQARLALCENWSIVMNKFGFVSLNTHDTFDQYSDGTGFAEINIGPKWTFLRSDSTGTVRATGLNFQIPTSSRAAQDTGTVGLDPYITAAQSFGRQWGFGSFNFMGQAGYSFAVDDKRAEYFHTALHLDWNVANNGK